MHSFENFGVAGATICNTIFVFENFNAGNPMTDIICGTASENWSFYRSIPASATEKSQANSKSDESTSD